MINKKGQGMSISTIILLILGIAILVILIIGFSTGWKPLQGLLGGGNNLSNLQTACSSVCMTSSQYDFCSVERTVKDGENDKFEATCQDLSTKAQYTSRGYGIEPCPGLCPAN